jgi:hypothetical protein
MDCQIIIQIRRAHIRGGYISFLVSTHEGSIAIGFRGKSMNFNVREVHRVRKLTKSKLLIQSQPLDHGGIYTVNLRQSQNQQLGEGMCIVF